MSQLHDLHAAGQSVWFDFIRRDMISSGELAGLIAEMAHREPDQRPTAQQTLAALRPQILPVSPRPEEPREQVGAATDRAIA